MADDKKQSTRSTKTKKKTTPQNIKGQKKNRSITNKKPTADFAGFHEEVIILAAIAIMIFFMLSNFSLCGKFGEIISDTMFGIFGGIQYVLPILIFLGVAFLVSNEYSSLAIKKIILSIICVLCISILWQFMVDVDILELKEVYDYSAKHHIGGGYIGGFIGKFLLQYLGFIGAYIAIIAILIIAIVLITERSFLSAVKKSSGQVAQNVRANSTAVRKSIQEAREVKEARKEKKALEAEKKLDLGLEKRTLVLPDNYTVPQREKQGKSKEKKQEIHLFEQSKTGIDFDLRRLKEREEEERAEQKLKEPKFHFMQVESEPKVETNVEPILEEKTKVSSSVLEEKTTIDGWNLNLDEIPTEEEQLLYGFEDRQSQMREIVPIREKQESTVSKTVMKKEVVLKEKQTEESKKKDEIKAVQEEIKAVSIEKKYEFPPISLLKRGQKEKGADSQKELRETAMKLQQTLQNFGVGVTITDVSQGPSVTRYELQPEQGVKVSKIVGLADDIKLNLAAADIRIEAPIPGKAAVGIEVPNKTNATVMFRDLIENNDFTKFPSDIAFAVGKDIGGKTILTDIAKMPHLLIAGATGSGKSVCINTLIMSILYKAKPSDVKLIMIDPKVVELSVYNGIPHLLIPVVTDPKKAASALNWAVMEMTDRYKKFAEVNVRNLKGYNEKVEEVLAQADTSEESDLEKLPQIIIIVDELADLMMVAPGEVEDAIVRLSQLARAAGIHLVIATQRPSVNVITGLIKANVPSRIAFSVSSGVDSRTIIDMNGAEKLLGKGDMLFYPSGYQKPVRVQGAFISDQEVSDVVEFLKENAEGDSTRSSIEIEEKINSVVTSSSAVGKSSDKDEYFVEAARFVIEKEKASIGMLQRMFKVGFNRAARIMEQLAEAGIVGEEEGTKPRKVLMSKEQFEQFLEEYI